MKLYLVTILFFLACKNISLEILASNRPFPLGSLEVLIVKYKSGFHRRGKCLRLLFFSGHLFFLSLSFARCKFLSCFPGLLWVYVVFILWMDQFLWVLVLNSSSFLIPKTKRLFLPLAVGSRVPDPASQAWGALGSSVHSLLQPQVPSSFGDFFLVYILSSAMYLHLFLSYQMALLCVWNGKEDVPGQPSPAI